MPNSVLLKSAQAITNPAQPRANRDRMVSAGTITIIDLARPDCVDLTGPLTDGRLVRNLVDGGVDGVLKVSTAGDLVAIPGKGIQLKAAAGAFGRVRLGTGAQYFQDRLGDDYLISCMVTFPQADPLGGHTGMFLSKSATIGYSGPGPWYAHRYPGAGAGQQQNGDVSGKLSAVAGNGLTNAFPPSPAGLHQLTMMRIGGTLYFDKDKVAMFSGATADLVPNANDFNFGNVSGAAQSAPPGMILHRFFLENLTTLAAATGVASTRALGVARMSAEYDGNIAKYAA